MYRRLPIVMVFALIRVAVMLIVAVTAIDTSVEQSKATTANQPKVTTVEQSKVTIVEQPKATEVEQPRATTVEQSKVTIVEQSKAPAIDCVDPGHGCTGDAGPVDSRE